MARARRTSKSNHEPAASESSVLDSVDCPELPEADRAAERDQSAVSVLAAVPVCGTARVQSIDGDRIELVFGSESVAARRDPSVHATVLCGALERGERVLAEHRPEEGWVVVGALRTQPTPGIDPGDEYTIEADRVVLDAKSEIALNAQSASIVVRAIGEIESYADRLISRAEGIHRIIGRILHLN